MADNLLDKASILLTPTAYNDGEMLSVKPENGDGDFTFSRGSAATRTNAQGLVENVQIISDELVSNGDFSQIGTEEVSNGDFSQGSQDWVFSSGASLTSLGAKITHTPTAGSIAQSSVLEIGKQYKITYEITENVAGGLKMNSAVDASMVTTVGTHTKYFEADLTSLSISRTDASNNDVTITNISVKEVGQDWSLDTGWSIGDDKVEADGTSAFLIQSNFQSVASVKSYKIQYEVLSTNGVNIRFGGGSSMFGTPTLDTTTIGVKTIYLQSNGTVRNLQFQNNLGFIGSITNISVKEITDDTDLPRIDYTDGCGSWLLEPQSTNLYLNSDTLVTQSNATSASTYTVYFYGTGTITFSGTHTGTLVGTGANDRVSVTFTATSGTLTSTISGTCEKGQLENLSYATSYIPTNGSIATRLADVATNSGNSTLINSTEGVLYAEFSCIANDGETRIISLSEDGNTANRINIFQTSGSNKIKFVVKVNSTNIFDEVVTLSNILNYNKIALSYKENEFKVYINGVKEEEQLSGSIYPANTLDKLNFDQGGGNHNFYGKVRELQVFKEALTDAQLQSLTTI